MRPKTAPSKLQCVSCDTAPLKKGHNLRPLSDQIVMSIWRLSLLDPQAMPRHQDRAFALSIHPSFINATRSAHLSSSDPPSELISEPFSTRLHAPRHQRHPMLCQGFARQLRRQHLPRLACDHQTGFHISCRFMMTANGVVYRPPEFPNGVTTAHPI